jgi:hypothetical protein
MVSVLLSLLLSSAFASPLVKELVPQGKIVSESPESIKVETVGKTQIELVFDDKGVLEEAYGKAAGKGDNFVPGQKMLPLDEIIKKLTGKTIQGEWIFEQNANGDWVYDIEGRENDKDVDYIINAETGAVKEVILDE